jgi:perosamine synthetase
MIPHNMPTLSNADKKAASRVLSSGWVSQGVEVSLFEEDLCNFFDLPVGHAVVVSSGSAALFLSLWALDCKNQRVGLPVYSCSALHNAIGLVGAKPVYLDCKVDSANLDLNKARSSILHTLIAPSMFGIPIETDQKRDYFLIEDIAQSFGSMKGNKAIGLRGDVGICSFYATKMFTSGGQGGAIISKNKEIIEMIKDYREFDNRRDAKLRFNLQMTDVQAAIGRSQLDRIPQFIETREKLFDVYQSSGLDMLDALSDHYQPVRYRAIIKTNHPKKIIETLDSNGFKAIVPIELEELLDAPNSYQIASKNASTTVSLPIYPNLSISHARDIVKCIKSIDFEE